MKGHNNIKLQITVLLSNKYVTSCIKTFWLTAGICSLHQHVYSIALKVGMTHYKENVNTKSLICRVNHYRLFRKT